jgi:hypothetical protein
MNRCTDDAGALTFGYFAAMTTAPDEDSSVEQALTGGAL